MCAQMMKYFEDPKFGNFREASQLLFEGADYLESLIENATLQGQVTLATRAFGRGTDFHVLDPRLLAGGGVHVLLTFYPKDISEEVQIMGRGARQGDDGSFSMVMNTPQIIRSLDKQVDEKVGACKIELCVTV